jgi:hypothetical protein
MCVIEITEAGIAAALKTDDPPLRKRNIHPIHNGRQWKVKSSVQTFRSSSEKRLKRLHQCFGIIFIPY